MKRISLMMAAAPLCSFYQLSEGGFQQPSLADADAPAPAALPVEVAPQPVDNTGKTDELSLAVVAEQNRNAIHIAIPDAPPGKYALDYVLDGRAIRETHIDLEHALGGVRRLRFLGIVPATSTL